MRRMSAAAGLTLLMMAAMAVPVAHAQEASAPPPMVFEIAPGVTAEALAFPQGGTDPVLYRLTFAPGVSYAFEPNPANALELGSVETGEIALTVSSPVTVTRGDGSGAEDIAADTEVALAAGDYLVLPAMTSGSIRNDGSEAASLVVAAIPVSSGATPGPEADPSGAPASSSPSPSA